jgi:hypothetical protein
MNPKVELSGRFDHLKSWMTHFAKFLQEFRCEDMTRQFLSHDSGLPDFSVIFPRGEKSNSGKPLTNGDLGPLVGWRFPEFLVAVGLSHRDERVNTYLFTLFTQSCP